jgi:WD40 repeat protein
MYLVARFVCSTTQNWSAFDGHTGAIASVAWSHSGSKLLTSSNDGTVQLWRPGTAHSLLHLPSYPTPSATPSPPTLRPRSQNVVASPKTAKDARSQTPNRVLGVCTTNNPPSGPVDTAAAVVGVQFFYLDRFIAVATGRGVRLHRWSLGAATGGDVARLKRPFATSLDATIELPPRHGHRVTAFTAHNGALSPYLIAAGSDNSIHILDVARCVPLATTAAAHSRTVVALCLLQASPHVAHSLAASGAILSACRGGCVKLWDTRVMRPMRAFASHGAATVPCAPALSPCGRFVAVGAQEPRPALVVYDVRGGGILQRVSEVSVSAPAQATKVALLFSCTVYPR